MDENTQMEMGTHKDGEGADTSVPLSLSNAIVVNALIIAAAIIAAAVIITHDPSSAPTQGQAPVSAATIGAELPAPDAPLGVNINNVKKNGEPYVGNPTAAVVVAYWSDFQCPYCKQFETTTMQDILKNYVATGKVVVVFKDYPFLGPDSTTAALYGRAVWDLYPDQYFAWREAMYNAQDDENAGFGDEASVDKLTASITGVDAGKVQKAVQKNMNAYQTTIDADISEGQNMGVRGTPSFVTGTTFFPGVTSYSDFSSVLNKQLK